jgi:hypothetical protein
MAKRYYTKSSTAALKLTRKLFEDAHKQNCFKEVWALVTALRGPDVPGGNVKAEITQPIRSKLITMRMIYGSAILSNEIRHRIDPARHITIGGIPMLINYQYFRHFYIHAERAAAVIRGEKL